MSVTGVAFRRKLKCPTLCFCLKASDVSDDDLMEATKQSREEAETAFIIG